MDDLSPQRREELAALLLRHGHAEWDEFDGQVVADALAPLVAGWLTAEREAGAAEVRARVEAVLTKHSTGVVTTLIDRRLLADLHAALGGES